MKIKFLFSLVLCGFFYVANSQTFIGAQLGTSYLIGLKPMGTVGLHLNTMIREQPFSFGLNYHLPIKYSGEGYANSINGNSDQILVPYTDKISAFDLHIIYRYYFNDAALDEGGFFGFGGLTLAVAREIITPGAYDKVNYRLDNFFTDAPYTYTQPYVTVGVGYDILLGNDHMLGFQFLLNLNGTSFNSRSGVSGDPSMPGMIGIRTTYALPIGE